MSDRHRIIELGFRPIGPSGLFEEVCAQRISEVLPPEGWVVISSLSLPNARSEFREIDIVVHGPDYVELVEVKNCFGSIVVKEDLLEGFDGFRWGRVFSKADMKARLLKERLSKPPFSFSSLPYLSTRVVVPDRCQITFAHKEHGRNKLVLNLSEYLQLLKARARPASTKSAGRLLDKWSSYRSLQNSVPRTPTKLGRFRITKMLSQTAEYLEYLAVDEPPCDIDVHLKEYLYSHLGDPSNIEGRLRSVVRDMCILRALRHPKLQCVTGHFRTGYSLVQVSDWFEGCALSGCWGQIEQMTLGERVALMIDLCDVMHFCHSKRVLHRSLSDRCITLSCADNDFRVGGFEFSRRLDSVTSTVRDFEGSLDPRSIPPELLLQKETESSQLGDAYQVGVLCYRILESGLWPIENALDYALGKEEIRPMTTFSEDPSIAEVRQIVLQMLSRVPEQRPAPIGRCSADFKASTY